ncbi:plasma platelet-activating factor acetylhydrolase (macronuclear) [Tetrahymena thermophila SB210]|uniref:1-alkyl-2-acetylglycerophosphocholine esterase n=1 Tax=Tetrahymena thermophila (strain SB210) TaxID=312017 RepID=Q22NV7_TETTS|nr:plasma platelet-activating factor acetylhydrolase [Tetrahymena thermophila SB210]EAR87054.1 plasma platelet-activating factor acetylhydrolase [Tetrahymena thermophila SB210]|eukprot:XP_001007299.1 plasma platelet-activating factor acetylhydrolase [Tetrahymena thermophila SB210]
MLQFQEKVFFGEYALSVYQFAQTIALFLMKDDIHRNQKWSLFGGFITFFLHKQFREGLRANSLLLLLNEALLLLRQTGLVKIPYWALLSSAGLYMLSIKKMKVFQFPKPRGSYHVGYIHRIEKNLLKNPQQDLQYSVYYPCVYDASKRDRNWMITENYWSRMHDTNMKDKERPGKVPKFFFRIQSQFLYKIKMGVLENAQLIPIEDLYYKSSFEKEKEENIKISTNQKQEKGMNQNSQNQQNENNSSDDDEKKGSEKAFKMKKFPVVIISHGLAAHCNAYTLFAKELASKGYIVFSMEHIEEIKNPYVDRQQNWEFRNCQLKDRLETSQKMLDIIYDKEFMKRIFNCSNDEDEIPIDYEKISILGHSFGGSTALYTAMNDQRITGVCIGLDPCVYVYQKEEIDLCEFPRPLLCINSEDFYKRLYPWFQNDESLELIFKNMKRYSDQSINCYIKGLAHANQSDLALVMAGEFDLYGITTRGECAKKHMFHNLMLFEYYFERVLIKDEKNLTNKQFIEEYFKIIGDEYKKDYIINSPQIQN